MIEQFLTAYLLVGVVMAIHTGAGLVDEGGPLPWYADLCGFVAVTLLWGPALLVDAARGE